MSPERGEYLKRKWNKEKKKASNLNPALILNTYVYYVCVRVCVFQSIKGQATVLVGCGWNVTWLTAACCGAQIPPTSPANGPFLSTVCTLTHTQSHRNSHTHTHTAVRSHRNNLKAVESPRSETVLLLIVQLLWRAISSGRRKRVCEGRVCVFSTPGVSHLGC